MTDYTQRNIMMIDKSRLAYIELEYILYYTIVQILNNFISHRQECQRERESCTSLSTTLSGLFSTVRILSFNELDFQS